jgi:hypothetical protein
MRHLQVSLARAEKNHSQSRQPQRSASTVRPNGQLNDIPHLGLRTFRPIRHHVRTEMAALRTHNAIS